jgi:hypothetical protein
VYDALIVFSQSDRAEAAELERATALELLARLAAAAAVRDALLTSKVCAGVIGLCRVQRVVRCEHA